MEGDCLGPRRLTLKQPPAEDPDDVVPSFDESWLLPPQTGRATRYWFFLSNVIACSRHVTVAASPEEVREVCREWARDLGWSRQKTGDFMVFDMMRFTPLPSPQLDIGTEHSRGFTHVTFTLSARLPGGAHYLQPVVDSFADGVCTELRKRGYEVWPDWVGRGRQHRASLRLLERWRGGVYVASLLIFPVVSVVALVAVAVELDRGFATVGAAYFWVVTILLATGYARWRILGAGISLLLVLSVIILVLAVVLTLAAILRW